MFDLIKPTARKSDRGFTIIELLVVVGIIGLLLAILIPAAGRVQQASRQIRCAGNLRQITVGCASYAAHNRRRLPSFGTYATGGNLWDVPVEFYEELRKQGVPHEAFFCATPDEYEGQQGAFTAFPGMRLITYSLWMRRMNGGDFIPPDPGDATWRFTYPQPMATTAFAGPDSLFDTHHLQNPIMTDMVSSNGWVASPAANADPSVENGYVLTRTATHAAGETRLGNINATWADGRVEVIFAGDVRPRYKGNWWNWR